MLFSIVVPVHNTGEHVEACARSILDQDFERLELILVDDGSTDDSWERCLSLANMDGRVRPMRQEHAGAGAARNQGLALAAGQYVGFVDSDDVITPATLSVAAIAIADEAPDIFTYSMEHKTWDGSAFDVRALVAADNVYNGGRELIRDLLAGRRLLLYSAANKLYDVGLLRRHDLKFRTDLDFGEDRLFNFACIRAAERMATSSHVGYHYLIRPTPSLSQRFRPRHITELLGLHNAKAALIDEFAAEHPERTPYLARDLRHEIRTAVRSLVRHWRDLTATARRREVTQLAKADYPSYLGEMPSDTRFRRWTHFGVRHESTLVLYALIAGLALAKHEP